MTPATYNLATVTAGDTWSGVPQIRVEIDGAAPSATLSRVALQIRNLPSSESAIVSLTSETGGGITISNSTTWTFSVPAQILALRAGTYVYDIETEDANGKIQTFLSGSILVNTEVTRP
jgi:hypothetical protein